MKSFVVSCGIGALVGSLIALYIGQLAGWAHYFWIAGALVGGLISYLIIDFNHLCSGIKTAYRQTVGWRPPNKLWKVLAAYVSLVILSMTSILGFAGIITLAVYLMFAGGGDEYFQLLTSLVFIGALLFVICSLTVAPIVELSDEHDIWRVAWIVSPPGLIYTGIRYSLPLLRLFRRLVTLTFLYVHTERRVACFVDGTIGATVGYLVDSPIIGAMSGMALGVASHYEIVHFKKMVPVRV